MKTFLQMALVCAICLTTTSVFAHENCDSKAVSTITTSLLGDQAATANRTNQPVCEGKKIEPKVEPSGVATAAADSNAASEPRQNVVYFGFGGSRNTDDFDALATALHTTFSKNTKAFSVGYLRTPNSSRIVGGVDIGYEGTMLDGTYGSYSTRGAVSFNGMLGVNVAKNDSVRFDVVGLIGARENTTDCPASYLGYACYADRPPDRSYSLNYGGLVSIGIKRLMIGARVTGASTQGLIGFRF